MDAPPADKALMRMRLPATMTSKATPEVPRNSSGCHQSSVPPRLTLEEPTTARA